MTGQPDYFGNERPEMGALVPANVRTLLDVGCGAGGFGAALKASRTGGGQPFELWGIERDHTAANMAAATYDRVLTGDVETQLPYLPDAHFDGVVMNDILEHLLEPADVLTALRPHLKPGGCLIASIPNVRYFNNVVDLAVRGRWDYTDEGILDRTHLRFFTRTSMIRLLEDCGYRVEASLGINPTGSLKFKLINILTLGRWADMRYLQFALTATVGTVEEK